MKVMVMSDIHAGSPFGLTHPRWHWKQNDDPERSKIVDLQRLFWNWYDKKLKEIGKVDHVVINGDAIEGKGKKSGGCELLTTDCLEQGDMAFDVINHVQASEYFMTYGTAYHTGDAEDFEKPIADKLNAQIGNHLRIDFGGLIFDFKHFIGGGGSSPLTKNNAVLKEQFLEILKADIEGEEKSDIFIRSHRHNYTDASGLLPNTRIFVTPALKACGEKYERVCSGIVDVGFLLFDITSKTKWGFTPIQFRMKYNLPEIIRT